MKTEAHWKKIGQSPHHGILVPLFALRANREVAIGEFTDLIPLIDWCKKIGFDTIQLLPLYDSGTDPSPYNPISSCALDPVYLHLPGFQSKATDRNEIKNEKLRFLQEQFQSHPIDWKPFLKKHSWVEEYGRYLGDLPFYSYVQMLCFKQLGLIKEHASECGIFLMGDLPYLVSPKSADVWAYPHLFREDLVAGAPPDLYNLQGQKWGFPLYNWDAMRKEKYAWWRRRLSAFESFYHIYRIDHVVGFFRIWGIEKDHPASHGHFIPEETDLWAPLGREILEMMIDASPLLPIAEDLGTIPNLVFPILKELGICGTKVVRWQHNLPPEDYEPFSLTTVSTPDMEPLPLLSHEKRFKILKKSHATRSYFHINMLQEYLALFPELSWPDPSQERINIPGTLNETNWRYRFRPTLQEIVSHEPLASVMKSLID